MNNFYKFIVIFYIVCAILIILAFFIKSEIWRSKNKFKRYVIENFSRIYIDSENLLKLTYLDFYFEEVSIKKMDENTYTIIAWGDRNSIFWYLFKDYYFTIDLKYKESKKKSIKLDKKVMRLFEKNEKL